uniref:Uncharacterized protein n=1 Tax=Clytia hemisphaerica TaxID=252671 RepID=A0A7M5X562_9CNID
MMDNHSYSQFTEFSKKEISEMLIDVFPSFAEKFDEHGLDGNLFVTLLTSSDQFFILNKMGLTVREILTFKSIYPQQNRGTRSSGIPNTPQSTVLENHLENVQQRYIRNQVVKKWPGNNLPTFNKDDTDNKKELEELVTKLSENPLLKSVVEADKVKSKVIQIMKERRRNVRKGMDYKNPPQKTAKKTAKKKLDLGTEKVDVVNSSGKTSTDGVDMTISKEVGKRKNQTTLIGTSSKKLRTSSSDKVKTQDSKKKMSPKTSTRIDTPSEESVRENPFTRSLGLFSPVEDSQQCSQQIENSQQTEESPFRLPWDTPVKIKNKEDAKEKINESGIHIGPLETDTG